jgi:hypothetical protein
MPKLNNYYSDEVISKFAERFGFPDDQRASWHADLEEGAQYYCEESQDSQVSIDDTKRALLRLVAAVQEVNEAFEAVDSDIWRDLADQSLLLRDTYESPFVQFEPMTDGPGYNEVEVVTYRYIQMGSETRIMKHSEFLCDTLHRLNVVSNIAGTQSEAQFKTERGPKPNWKLRHWATQMMRFWARYTGTKPTFDSEKGVSVSDTAQFIVEAFKWIDPTVSERKVLTAMRAIMSDAPKGRVSPLQNKSGNLEVFLPTDSRD